MSNKIQFVVDRELLESVNARTQTGHSSNATARRDLGRYYEALRYALASVELTESEAKLIVNAMNGCWLTDIQTPSEARAHLVMEIEDSMRLDGTAKKWGVDSDKLRNLLAHLDDVQAIAVVDAVERFWASDDSTVQEVGLVSD